MNKPVFYTTFIFLMHVMFLQAQQNLVVNGDMELYSDCPQSESSPFQNPKEIEKCSGWKAPTYGTSDYFNVCATNPTISVPINFGGEQFPYNGNGYLGGYCTSYGGGTGDDGYNGIMWWEYIQGQTVKPLEQGKIYKFSMEISLAEYSDLLINEIGVHFSNSAISSPNTASLSVIPQLVFHNSNYFTDTANWIHLETLFLSQGGEQYLTIGNFRNNMTTDTLRRYNYEPFIINPNVTYMYIDNVIICEAQDLGVFSNVFTPNDDGINDYWTLSLLGEIDVKITIMNRWGNQIYESQLNNFSWDGKLANGNLCSEGVYFYKISDTNITGFIQLVR